MQEHSLTAALPDVGLPVLLEQFVDIACDAQTAWAFIMDMENYIQWFPAIVQMQSDDALPIGAVGKTYRETAILPGGKEEKIKVVVVAANADLMHLAIEASLQPVLPRFDYRVVATGNGKCRFFLAL